MSKNFFLFFAPFLFILTFILMLKKPLIAYEKKLERPAIVLSAFGTTYPESLKTILYLKESVAKAFPGYDVHLAFTSNFIRNKWRARANDKNFRKANPDIPAEIYDIKNPLATLALIQDKGPRDIIVQSLHIVNGAEYGDLYNVVQNLSAIKASQKSLIPFPYLKLGDSALGKGTSAELKRAALALAPLVEKAKKDNAALLLMGHGNEDMPLKVYSDLEKVLENTYNYPIYIGLVEGEPGFDEVEKKLAKSNYKTVLLAPLMLVAGDHANNDMAGPEPDSWLNQLKSKDYKVFTHLVGLGLLESWGNIYIEKIKELEKKY